MKEKITTSMLRWMVSKSCVFFAAIVLSLIVSTNAKAFDPDSGYCWIQSLTLEIGGKEYVFDDQDRFFLDADISWNDFFKSIKIKDYTICIMAQLSRQKFDIFIMN